MRPDIAGANPARGADEAPARIGPYEIQGILGRGE